MPAVSGNVGALGPAAGTFLPVADSPGVTVNTTTYNNPITGSGKVTALVFPIDTAMLAVAVTGDVFPRIIVGCDPTDGFFVGLGDGTFDPSTDSKRVDASIFQNTNGGYGLAWGGNEGSAAFASSNLGANRGGYNNSGQIVIDGHSMIASGTGDPNGARGGEVGDIYFRTTGGALTTIYRCTVAGDNASATWVGIL